MAVFLDPAGEPVQFKAGERVAKLQNCVVMYSTGLATRGGHPIWEADILDVTIPTEFGSVLPARGFMQWDSMLGKWHIHIPNPPILVPDGEFPVVQSDVAGNIYQQPDLLKI